MGYHHPRFFRLISVVGSWEGGKGSWNAVGASNCQLNDAVARTLGGGWPLEVKLCNGQIVRVCKLSEERRQAREAAKRDPLVWHDFDWRNNRQPQELPYWMKTPPLAPPSDEEQRRLDLQSPRKYFYLSDEEQNRLDSRNSR